MAITSSIIFIPLDKVLQSRGSFVQTEIKEIQVKHKNKRLKLSVKDCLEVTYVLSPMASLIHFYLSMHKWEGESIKEKASFVSSHYRFSLSALLYGAIVIKMSTCSRNVCGYELRILADKYMSLLEKINYCQAITLYSHLLRHYCTQAYIQDFDNFFSSKKYLISEHLYSSYCI